jgi:oligopeptidase B
MTGSNPTPPTAKVVPHTLEKHGHVRTDDYYWLNRRDDPEVIAYLEAENAYTEAVMAHTADLQEALFQEIKGRIVQTDSTAPYKRGDCFYYTRYEEGKEYPIHCRKRGTLDAPEQVMLDVNVMAEGHAFYAVAGLAVSSGQNLLAYAVDAVGRRIYTIHVLDLSTGELLPDTIPDVTANMAWAEDNRTLFYARQDPTTLRSYRIYRHRLGGDPATDVLVYEETDETYSCYVHKTKSRRYLLISSHQTLSTEYRCLEADDPEGEFRVLLPREREHEYSVDHCGHTTSVGDHFYIRTNDQAKNFRLVRAPVDRPGREGWQEVVPHRDDVLLEGCELFTSHLVVVERKLGLIQMCIRAWADNSEHYLDLGEAAYLAHPGDNWELDTPVLRYAYTSMTTPDSVYDYDMVTRKKTLVKQQEVLGGFDAANYVTERLWATAGDGAQVPISIVYRRGPERARPLLLYGYGSYGYSMDAAFSAERVSLLDRGWAYAIAHVRGGQELGRRWYEEGKLLNKKNTFTDFIACAEHLVAEGYTAPDRLFAMGGSAGGLLMGAILNARPDLFRGIVAAVPFVDVVTTMLDESIPLTTSEYDEWGNPNDKTYYDHMLSYSPYDNLEAQEYPNLLVTTSLHDSQVQYWEPAKWVARLRALQADVGADVGAHGRAPLLRTKMDAGHGGVSGRYKRYRETAFIYAFLLNLVPDQDST